MLDVGKGKVCPQCEQGKLGVTKKNLRFTYKGKAKLFRNMKLFKCNVCDYEALSAADTKAVDKALTDFRRSIDGLLTGSQLERIRKSLSRNKKRMAKLLGVNEKTIGRYENGIITQSEQIDKLYRILGAYPAAAKIIDLRERLVDIKTVESTYNPTSRFGPRYNLIADDYSKFMGNEQNVEAA